MAKNGRRKRYVIDQLIKPPPTRSDDLRPLTQHERALFTMGGRTTARKVDVQPSVSLAVSDEVAVGWEPDEHASGPPIIRSDALGSRLTPRKNVTGPGRELVIGLDFGTSSTKVVVADQSLNVGYAVPLVDGVGASQYLLPSVLIETDEGFYSLSGDGFRHADLKLAMLGTMDDDVVCSRVCAFLGLVIRSARAWLYENKGDQYLRADILWTLALGQPASASQSDSHRDQFEQLAKVAWALAAKTRPISVNTARKAWRLREKLELGDELEVRTMAELTAQIHGFVSSSHFDERQPNVYLMVDVGAGTLDASVFRVKKDAGGTVSFALFTHSVELLGAANFNRYRVGWWQAQLSVAAQHLSTKNISLAQRTSEVEKELDQLKLPTEYRGRYPDDYYSYLKGVKVLYEGSATSPDKEYFSKVLRQVSGQVLYGAWIEGLLSQDAIKGMPFYLCGGGARHSFYGALKTELRKTPNCSWLNARPRELVLPANMAAPGLAAGDFDRLSVAYGLSQLSLGAFERVSTLRPEVTSPQESDWISSTAEKSAC